MLLVNRLETIIYVFVCETMSRTVVKDARATVSRAQPSHNSLDSIAEHSPKSTYVLTFAQRMPLSRTKDALGSSPCTRTLDDARQCSGYHGRDPVTRVQTADRYLGHDDDIT